MDSTRNIYIAVIDDDERLCLSMSRLVRAAHLQPITYLSAEAFLADTKRPKFDCLVLDIQLTGMSGLDLRRRLSAVMDVRVRLRHPVAPVTSERWTPVPTSLPPSVGQSVRKISKQ
jgi:FixJ family two-component response regulator